ncbi:Ser/Thr protein phosphatase, putative [Trichomonas vaginalis G3]|uniref:Serine/threonine-protein phosphatase T n=1 Tax=Trichomonas vaginalis (strain ATCC PRA-98 / G3) TaxID=412133 RepID=A2FC29_TRIV3|nr:serine/threonine-protein phosphatase 5-related family [Trichomonas vaginalis G3]EAX97524.1 Ser/Thr protein phosphatase, putative [Trichomonas vaginalis G3]KAI5512972.1 serine/threonine-protein phosphatase 5-related family [Trichomonas vaginalis G3]|eukprot:XP_001310454.1 Ser/Thr protein phosphatase [Trichomonas vaginalis G3]
MSNKVEKFRKEGNDFFTAGKYFAAYDSYKKAIEECKNGDNTTLSIIYSSLSAAALLLERNSEAIDTATKSIELDNKNSRAYFRRGNAYATNLAWEEAYEDYLQASKLAPATKYFKDRADFVKTKLNSPPDLMANAGRTQIPKQEDLPQVIPSPKPKPEILPAKPQTAKDSSEFSPDSIKAMMKNMLNDQRPPEQTVLSMIRRVRDLYFSLPNVVNITVPKIHVVGDTHGQLQDVINIFETHGYPSSENPYLFNGDFVDRGSQGSEIVISLMAWKLYDNNCMFMNRGNHETDAMNQLYGFYNECDAKFSKSIFSEFSRLFCALPIAHIINNKVIVLHGGLPSRTNDINVINRENRNCQPPDNSIIAEILWADPMEGRGLAPSPRGVARQFGSDITEQFLRQNNLELLIRSHQVQENGYCVMHSGKCITVFSAPNYVGNMGNKGAIVDIKFDGNGNIASREFKTFTAKPIPEKYKPMKYAAFSFY